MTAFELASLISFVVFEPEVVREREHELSS